MQADFLAGKAKKEAQSIKESFKSIDMHDLLYEKKIITTYLVYIRARIDQLKQ